jgi:hypothetical protein
VRCDKWLFEGMPTEPFWLQRDFPRDSFDRIKSNDLGKYVESVIGFSAEHYAKAAGWPGFCYGSAASHEAIAQRFGNVPAVDTARGPIWVEIDVKRDMVCALALVVPLGGEGLSGAIRQKK